MVNWIQEYKDQIDSGAILANKKVTALYNHLVHKLEHQDTYVYDNAKAQHAIEFIETFCHQSKGSNKLLNLMIWQKAFISALFGFVDTNGYREYREAALIVARKNGKSGLASAIASYMLFCDNEPGAEIYSVATKREQAKITWNECVSMVKKSPALRKRSKCLVSEVKCNYNDGILKPLSSDSNTLDGLNVSAAILDEVHAWKDKNLYDVIVDGTTARKQPLILITSTAGTVRDGIYDMKYEEYEKIIKGYTDGSYIDEKTLPIIYELDTKDELYDENKWIKANPAIDVIKSRIALRDKVYKAKHEDRLIKNLLCKDFNIRETSTQSYFTAEDISNESTYDFEELRPKYYIGGFDLSQTIDLTCATALFKVGGDNRLYVKQMYWIPEDTLDLHIKQDKYPYDIWIDRGLMRTCHGNRINQKDVMQWFVDLQQENKCYAFKIGYDAWSAGYLVQDMKSYFGDTTLIPIHQTKKQLSLPMQNLKALLQKNLINYNNNPILKVCMANTEADIDVNGNIQPAKNRNRNIRIDGFSSLLDAYATYELFQSDFDNQVSW